MVDQRHVRKSCLIAVLLLNFPTSLLPALAQQNSPRTLDEILLRLESNLNDYDNQIPNFFCDEHVVSLLTYDKKHQSTITDSIFRLERTSNPGQPTKLAESHEIKTVNGTPSKGNNLGGPAVLSGVFLGGLNVVSLSQKPCMRYTLQPMKPEHPGDPYVIQFATLSTKSRPSGCVLKEESTGRVVIDPVTMQVIHMELTAPHHIINVAEVGAWNISIDYAPVLLGKKTFWLPIRIASKAIPNEAYDQAVYSFDARYTNCHKLEVTSRILPFKGVSKP